MPSATSQVRRALFVHARAFLVVFPFWCFRRNVRRGANRRGIPMSAGTQERNGAAVSGSAVPAIGEKELKGSDSVSLPLRGPPQLKAHTWYILNRAAQRLREMVEAALLKKGLRRRHYAALCVIETEGPITQRQLSDRIPLDRVAIVSVIDDLEEAKLAKRQKDPGDRRAYRLELTPKGARLLQEARTLVDAAEAEGLAVLSAGEQAQIDCLAHRLCGWEPRAERAAGQTADVVRRRTA
jgi:MarR family transcriptional regulator, lower aerobic nicotinate degradation pathway regulator